nr:nonribosomal peptide synthetase 8131 [Ostreopsis cf. ovata]
MRAAVGLLLLLRPAVAGFIHHAMSFSRLGDVKPGQFPWPEDYRDPNTAWTTLQKLAFLLIYVLCWAAAVLLVYKWPSVKHIFAQLGSRRPRAVNGAADLAAGTAQTGGQPLLNSEAREVNVGPTPPWPTDKRVIELFEEQVNQRPTETALIIPGTAVTPQEELSYCKFNEAVVELANGLQSMGVTCGTVVALVLDRSVAQVVATYGVLKAGGAFLPVDSDAPPARQQFLVVESEALAVIGPRGSQVVQQLATDVGIPFFSLPVDSLGGMQMHRPRAASLGCPSRSNSYDRWTAAESKRPEAHDMALLIYTSGTTGAPKGIVYDHQHLMHGSHFFGYQCEVDSSSIALLKSPYFWAIFEWEMFPAPTTGGKLVIASAAGHKSPEYLANTIYKQSVSVLMITPQVLDLVLDVHESQSSIRPLRSVKHIVTVGEPLSCAVANRAVSMRGVEAQVHNFYGASESSCTVYTVPKDGIDLSLFPNKAPAGTPQPHVTVYVMAVESSPGSGPVPVPTGESGEIYFGGVLAACYWKHEDLTKQKWLDTERYGRLYRTGDLGRWRDGVLEVVGRTDRQVKIRGVRVEPEEVEAVLKKFLRPLESITNDIEVGSDALPGTARAVLKDVVVVASDEPSELVAFVTARDAVEAPPTIDELKSHCQANLTPAYVPKFFVVLSELPRLPNGKPNLKALKEQATQRVNEEGQVVMDSLGQMKKLSKWALFENAVIHRCYSYWMIGVLLDHYMRCAADTDASGAFYAFCTPLAGKSVKPWSEVLIRSFGNDQDLFGFVMLGAYQDARPDVPGGRPRVKLGLKDLFIFAVYMLMAMPFPQILHFIFRGWAWPHTWGGRGAPQNVWSWDYMEVNSYTSDHRWYLAMVLQVRIYMQIMEKLNAPGWLQGIIALIPCLLPDAVYEGQEYAFDVCENVSAPSYVLYSFSWLFRNWGDGCAMFWRWIQWYFAFYVWCFHYLRPVVARLDRVLPKGPTWAAAALGASMSMGVAMALFHYPNNVLENGTGMRWAVLEIGVDILQPTLFVLGMTYLPWNLQWWGNTTLGCYCFHFYFKDQMCAWVMAIAPNLAWDPTGLILVVVIVAICLLVTTFLGPLGHYVLLLPTFVYARLQRLAFARARAREARAALMSDNNICRPSS